MPKAQEIGFDISRPARLKPLPLIVFALGYAIAAAALAIAFFG